MITSTICTTVYNPLPKHHKINQVLLILHDNILRAGIRNLLIIILYTFHCFRFIASFDSTFTI